MVRFEATEAFGGRGVAWHLQGEPNVLKIGEAVQAQPHPEVSAQSGDIAYLGHDVWVGPQNQWWLHQDANPERREAAANWPPDPFLSLAETRLVGRTDRKIVLEGGDSPVSGIRLRKTFALSPRESNTLSLTAEARNVRSTPVSWDCLLYTSDAADE